MQTCKPISTISYNSEEFLQSVLDNLVKTHVIDFYMYIKHIGEMDLFGEQEKDHIHLFLIPNKRINTADLDAFFIEPVQGNKPLKCISWNISKSDDWILYVLHDQKYLATKFETRQYEYTYGEIKTSDTEDLRRRYRVAYQSSGYAKMQNLYQYARSGGTLNKLLEIGAIPVNQIQCYDDYFKISRKIDLTNKE